MSFTLGQKVIGYYHMWKDGNCSTVNYIGTLVHIAPNEEGVYIVETDLGEEVLVEIAEGDVMELNEREQRQ
jgi:hypothetical protein